MSVLYVARPVALALASLTVAAFAFSVRGGQFDDLETPPLRMFFDDPPTRRTKLGAKYLYALKYLAERVPRTFEKTEQTNISPLRHRPDGGIHHPSSVNRREPCSC